MQTDNLTNELYQAICDIPLIDPHSHIDPHRPTARSLDDILGYHYYTELAHSAGMGQSRSAKDVPPRERVRAILAHMDRFDNTVQYSWFLDIARDFLGFEGDRVTAGDCDCAVRRRRATSWPSPTGRSRSCANRNVEKIFLTNDFDDPLTGFDTSALRSVPAHRRSRLPSGQAGSAAAAGEGDRDRGR